MVFFPTNIFGFNFRWRITIQPSCPIEVTSIEILIISKTIRIL